MTLYHQAADMLERAASTLDEEMVRGCQQDIADMNALAAELRAAAALDELVRENERLGLYDDQKSVAADAIAGALYDFLGYLTTRDETLCMGATQECSAVVPALQAWAKTRNLPLDEANVKGWRDSIAAPAPAQPRQPLSDDEIWASDEIMAANAECGLLMMQVLRFTRAVERAYGIGAITGDKP